MKKLKMCECGIYTLKNDCPKCMKETFSPHPAKFSPQDKYGKYRRLLKKSVNQNG